MANDLKNIKEDLQEIQDPEKAKILLKRQLITLYFGGFSDFNAFFTVFRDKPSFFAIFLVPIPGFRFFMFLIVIQSSIEITSKPPAINQEYFSNLGGSIFDGKSGSILGGNLQYKTTRIYTGI
ncbi:hypothetical protein METP2_01680 [Methanosarcinales archaeon]|nr:hypothetical protein METP2_01680 [Methanosarcinales archaeon]